MKEVIIDIYNELKRYSSDKIYLKNSTNWLWWKWRLSCSTIAQMFSLTGQMGEYLLVDPDVIESKNLRNQFFY